MHKFISGNRGLHIKEIFLPNQKQRSQVVFFADAGAAGAALPELLAAGDVVLLKGSRGVGLEKTLDRVVEAFAPVEQGVE